MKSRLALMCLLPSLAFAQAVENVTPGNISFGGGSLTFDGDSLNSSVGLQAPRFDISSQDWIYYVDPAGDDENDCLSAASPCKTFRAAWDKLPDHWAGKARIVLAAGTYTVSGINVFDFGSQLGGGEPLVVQGPMIDSGLGELEVTSVATYGSGYAVSVTDSSVSPSLDEYKGYFLRMTTCAAGAGCVGMTRIIKGNSTGGQFDLNLGSTSSSVKPAIGDNFVIEKPGAVISHDNQITFVANGSGRQVSGYPPVDMIFYQIGFTGTNYKSSLVVSNLHAVVKKVRVDTDGSGFLVLGASFFSDIYAISATSDELLGSAQEYGAGLYVKSTAPCTSGSSLYVTGPAHSWMIGLVTDNARVLTRYGGTVLLTNPQISGCGIYSYKSYLSIPGSSYGPLPSIDGASSGIQLAENSYLDLGRVSGTNTNYGVTIAGNSTLSERSTSAPTITGGTGDVSLGADTLTHANISGGTFYSTPPFGAAFSDAATVDPRLKAGTITSSGNISTSGFSASSDGVISMDSGDSTGTPGNATCNLGVCRFAVDAAASSATITSSAVEVGDTIICTLQEVDATCTGVQAAVAASGSYTVTLTAACTAATDVACVAIPDL